MRIDWLCCVYFLVWTWNQRLQTGQLLDCVCFLLSPFRCFAVCMFIVIEATMLLFCASCCSCAFCIDRFVFRKQLLCELWTMSTGICLLRIENYTQLSDALHVFPHFQIYVFFIFIRMNFLGWDNLLGIL